MHIITLFYLTSVKSDSSVNRTFSSSTFYARVTFPGVQLSLFWWQKYTTRDSNWGQHMQKGLLKWTKPSTLSYNYDFWNKYLLLNVYTSTLCCFFAVVSDGCYQDLTDTSVVISAYWSHSLSILLLIPYWILCAEKLRPTQVKRHNTHMVQVSSTALVKAIISLDEPDILQPIFI